MSTPITLYTATVTGQQTNTRYPHQRTVTAADELTTAATFDHVAAEYQGNMRSATGFITSNCLVMDIDNDHTDNPDEWVTPATLESLLPAIEFYTATSRNHLTPKGVLSARPRFHVYLPIKPVTEAAAYAGMKKNLAARYDFFDANAVDAARFMYGNPATEITYHPGELLIDELLIDQFADFDQATQQIAEGSRNATMSRFAGRILIRFGNTTEARELFNQRAAQCNPPLPEAELESIWNSATRFATRIQSKPGYLPPEQYAQLSSLKPDDLTDIGQAEVLAAEYHGQLRHSPATDWIVYADGYWQETGPGAHGLAQELTKRQLIEAVLAFDEATGRLKDTGASSLLAAMTKAKALSMFSPLQHQAYQQFEEAEKYLKYVLKRRESRAVAACLREAQPILQVVPSDLDADPYLLNTPTATYDLRHGDTQARDHSAEDLITKQTSLDPDAAGADIWAAALEVFFQHDAELMAYVQRIVGLSAFGKVMVEALIIAYGDGRNGKSTFWNVIARVLGTYSGNISADVLTVGQKRNVKPELAEAKGKRLLIAAELEEGMRLNTSNVKQLASTDEIYAEKKYRDPFAYTPSHTLVLYTNHLPRVGAMDAGIWRRLIVIPFEAKIEGDSDIKNYADYLFEHAGGAILAWIMEGARLIHAEKYQLVPPAVVQQAVAAYRETNDWFSRYVEECCEVDTALTEGSGALYQEYRAWSARTGEYPRSTTDFYQALEQSGFTRRKTKRGYKVYGLALTSEFITQQT